MAIIRGMQPPVVLATHEWSQPGTDARAGAPVAVLVHGVTGWNRYWWLVGPARDLLLLKQVERQVRQQGESMRWMAPR